MPTSEVRTSLPLDGVLDKLGSLPLAISGGDATLTRFVLEPVGGAILGLICERFDALGVPGGTYSVTGEQWADNSPVTVRLKRGHARTRTGRRLADRGYQGYAVGVDSGDMRESFEPSPEGGPSGHPLQVFRIDGGAVTVGTSSPVAESFNDGNPDNHQPPRPLLPEAFPPAWDLEIGQAAAEGMADAIVTLFAGSPGG